MSRSVVIETGLDGLPRNHAEVNASNELRVAASLTAPADGLEVALITNGSVIDAGNSTTTPLSGGGNFTGAWVELLGYSSIAVTVNTDADSAVDGMLFELSTNGVDVDDDHTFSFTNSGTTRRFQFPVTARYFRVNYTTAAGGPGAQTFFRLQVILHTTDILTSIHRSSDSVDPDRSSTLVSANLIAQVNGVGDFVPIQASAGGILKVSSDVESVLPGTGALNLGKAEDDAHADGDVGVMALAVRNDAASALAGTDGDYIPLTTDSDGALWVRQKGDTVTTDHLSGSTNGQPIQITATTSGEAVTLHTADATNVDRLFIYLTNVSDSPEAVTIEFGTTGAGNEIDVIVPPHDTLLAVAGAVIGGAASQVVKAYATVANVINAFGRVETLS